MIPGNSPLFGVLLALAATFLGLSVLVQVIQEIYKYLTSSKPRAYNQLLRDFLGPWIAQLYRPGVIPDLVVRGPLQFFRRRPRGRLLPLGKENLIKALERTAPDWHQQALKYLRMEVKLQGGIEKSPSPSWNTFLMELAAAEKGSPGYWNAQEIIRFLENWEHKSPKEASGAIGPVNAPATLNAASILTAFYRQFLPHLDQVDEHYSQLLQNFEFVYRRRNLRQTFTFGFILALDFNLSFDQIYRNAGTMSASEATALADRTLALYATYQTQYSRPDTGATAKPIPPDSSVLIQLQKARETMIAVAARGGTTLNVIDLAFVKKLYQEGQMAVFRYLFGCLLTALLISFGAPFWNDLAGMFGVLQRGRSPASQQPSIGGDDA
jgi:hypothetical protein